MSFNEYQESINAIQEHFDVEDRDRLAVIALGLAGESGEVIELVKKAIRDNALNTDRLKLELGDVLAYVSLLGAYFKIPLDDIASSNIDKLYMRLSDGTLHGEDIKVGDFVYRNGRKLKPCNESRHCHNFEIIKDAV